jgi:ATP-binding cassette subfamily F protein 3
MSVVVGRSLEKRYGDDLVFTGLDFAIGQGDRIGLVGPNGSGKSSLLRVIGGLDDYFDGQLTCSRELTIGYLAQEPPGTIRLPVLDFLRSAFRELEELGRQLENLTIELETGAAGPRHEELLERYAPVQAAFEAQGGYTMDSRLEETLANLRIPEASWQSPVSDLSGGQRTRLHLGHVLLEQPQLLLLDEPTNYLDEISLPWLIRILKDWSGSVVVVSHNHAFLEQVPTRIWELDRHGLTQYKGNHAAYRQQRAARRERQAKEYAAQQAFVAKTEEFIRRNKAGVLSRQARGRETRLARHLEQHGIERVHADPALRFSFPSRVRSGDIVLRTYGLVVGYGPGKPILRVPDLELRRQARVAVVGPNGAGKSTLLRTLVGHLELVEGEFEMGASIRPGYFAQHHVRDEFSVLDPAQAPFDLIKDQMRLKDQDVRDHLGAFQLSGEDVFRPLGTLSGGQKSRLMFAYLALQDTNLLVLDEPLSHFDSHDALLTSLQGYGGTILVVSHDQHLVANLATQVWHITPGQEGQLSTLEVFQGSWSAWRNKRANGRRGTQSATTPVSRMQAAGTSAPNQSAKRQRAETERSLEREIDLLDQKMEAVLERLNAASAAGDGEAIRKLQKAHRFLQDESDGKWAALAELYEA